VEHPDEGFPCNFPGCLETFSGPALAREHERFSHQTKVIPCPKAKKYDCSMMFSEDAEAQRHVRDKHPYRGLKCRTCGNKFSNWQYRKDHEKIHSHPFCCPLVLCGIRFRTAKEALEHSVKGPHSDKKLYTCPVAGCRARVVGIFMNKGHFENHWQ
jgi:hypothetical protein